MTHYAFTECATNGANFILSIASVDNDGRARVDALIERELPLSGGPAQVIREFAKLLRGHRCSSVMGARHSSHWVREGFARAGISYGFCALERPDLPRDFLAALDDKKIELPKHSVLTAQLRSVRYREKDHGQHGDDLLTTVADATLLPPSPVPDTRRRRDRAPYYIKWVIAVGLSHKPTEIANANENTFPMRAINVHLRTSSASDLIRCQFAASLNVIQAPINTGK